MTIIIDGTVGANKAVVLDSNGKLPVIDGSLVTTLNATQVTTGSIATARIDTGTTTGKVLVLDGSGNMPAIAAGSMTGVSASTKSASDPTISTNPSGGLGTKWINTTSGEIFILTDATAGSNVWTSTGGTSGDIEPFHGSGDNYGYIMGGAPGPYSNIIQKYSYTSATDSVDVANLTHSIGFNMGHSSETYGYASGGGYPASNIIDKHQFGTTNNSTDVGDLVHGAVSDSYGVSSPTHGFVAGGYRGANKNEITTFSFSADGNATDVADMSVAKSNLACSSSATHGYAAGGETSWPNFVTHLEKFSFSTQANSTVVADIGDNGHYGHGMGGHES